MNMQTKKIEHVFSYYPFYALTLGNHPIDNHAESFSNVMLTNDWLTKYRPDLRESGLSILEVLSGMGEHRPYFLIHANFPVKCYHESTMFPFENMGEHVRIGDCTSENFGCTYDLIIANYYSSMSTLDRNMMPSRETMESLFDNMYRHLNDGGCFNLSISPDVYHNSIDHMVAEGFEEDGSSIAVVPFGHQLRADFNLPLWTGHVELSTNQHNRYDRVNIYTIQEYFDCHIRLDGEKVAEIEVEKPFIARYWTEGELIDMAKKSGFTDFMFYRENKMVEDNVVLNNVEIGYLDSLDNFNPTRIVFIK